MAEFAALSMYDFPEILDSSQRLWASISTELNKISISAPASLGRPENIAASWQDPDLTLAQTCGFPYVNNLRGKACLIGTPDYGVVAGRPGWYYSVVLVRKSDEGDQLAAFRDRILVYSSTSSQSGCHAMMYLLKCEIGNTRFFGDCVKTGGHAASVSTLLDGSADIAAVDVITWHFLQRFMAGTDQLRVLLKTNPTPGLPFITSLNKNAAKMTGAVQRAIDGLAESDRTALHLKGFWAATDSDYDLIETQAEQSAGVLQAHGLAV